MLYFQHHCLSLEPAVLASCAPWHPGKDDSAASTTSATQLAAAFAAIHREV